MLQCLKIVFWGFYHLYFFEFLIAWSVKTLWGDHLFLRGGAWHILSQCDPMWVQDKGQEQVQQISSRSTDCIFVGPRINLMSTKILFYIVKGFGLIKRGMRVKRKCKHFKCNQGFSSKAACHKKKKLTCHACLVRIISCFWIADSM
jgi:hypothetical protein